MDYDDRNWCIDNRRARTICRAGQGTDTCRYLIGINKWLACAQHDARLSHELDKLVEARAMKATNVNCEGIAPYPISLTIEDTDDAHHQP